MKQALVYSPYWDTGGGGEKYAARVVKILQADYRVTLAWKDRGVITAIRERFDIDLRDIKIDSEAYQIIRNGGWWRKRQLEKGYDLGFMVSDGSVPASFAKTNLLHFQVPFHQVKGRLWLNRLKLSTYNKVICNSYFTKKVIDQEFGIKSQVIYPPITQITPEIKQALILSVGRFDNLLHAKRQDILIEAFKQLKPKGWRLVIAGGVLQGGANVETLKAQAKGQAVEIMVNPSHTQLKALYREASIYWHAAGYGQDLNLHPEKAEHFGMTTVEAMSAGAVPLVFAGGGQIEIITDGENGFLWLTMEDLIMATQKLIGDESARLKLAGKAQLRAKYFDEEEFDRQFSQLVR